MVLTGLLLLLQNPATAQEKKEVPKKTRILFLLDCSGSMLAKWNEKERLELRIDAAKRILTELVDSLKETKNLELALRCYGHQYDKNLFNCEDTKLEVSFGPNNTDLLKQKIKALTPKGTTPIAYSLLQAANDFPPADKNTRNVIIIITDGLESCKGDPCAISLALQKRKIFLKPFVIGIGKLEDYGKAMDCMGKFVNAEDSKNLKTLLYTAVKESLEKTYITVRLFDSYDKPTETNVNVSFINRITGEAVYDFVHRLDNSGKFEHYEIDPLMNYDVIVNTVPQVIRKDIQIQAGKENYIDIKCPQGYLTVNFQSANSEYKNPQVLVKQDNNPVTINNQKFKATEKYLVGKYDIEILTMPRIYRTIEIKQDENTEINLPIPGVLNIPQNTVGYGSLYVVKLDGSTEWIYNFENNTSKINMPLQPGNYKVVFRSKDAISSKYTDVQYFTVRPGLTSTINLFNK